jgi:hypothetical protein
VIVFSRAADGRLLERRLANDAWSAWSAVPGLEATSGPAAVSLLSTVQLFARGPGAGNLWQSSYQDGRWSRWIEIPGPIISAPSAVVRRGRSIIDIAVRGTDNGIWTRSLTPGNATPWSPWVGLGGNFTAGPAIVSWTENHLDVFATAANSDLLGRYWDQAPGWNTTWFTTPGGATLIGAPAAVSREAGQFDVFARWADSTLHQRHYSPAEGNWGPWMRIDHAPLASSPAVVSDHAGRMFVFARIGGELKYRVWNALPAAQWGDWISLGPVALPTASPVTPVPAAPGPAPAPAPAPVSAPTRIVPILSFDYRATTRRTRFARLTVKGVPSGATVQATCPKGCASKTFTKRNAKGAVSLRRLIRRPLSVGTTITVVVSKPGMVSGVKVLRVRARKAPSVATRCLAPGAVKPAPC